MAINANETLKNRHQMFLASSGGGKTFKVQQLINQYLKKDSKNTNVIVFDEYGVYGDLLTYVTTYSAFVSCLKQAAIDKKPVKIAYGGAGDFDKVCRAVWAFLDGNMTTLFVAEEAGNYLHNAAKSDGWWYKLITVGRKFGLVFLPVSQRPQNINKVVYDQVGYCWIGYTTKRAKSYIEKDFNVDLAKIDKDSYSYYFDSGEQVIPLYDKNDNLIK